MAIDDFKIAGPSGHWGVGWQTITDGINGPVSTYLGCDHVTFEGTVDTKPARGIHSQLQPFMESCVDAHRQLVGKLDLHMPMVDTPALANDGGGARRCGWRKGAGGGGHAPPRTQSRQPRP